MRTRAVRVPGEPYVSPYSTLLWEFSDNEMIYIQQNRICHDFQLSKVNIQNNTTTRLVLNGSNSQPKEYESITLIPFDGFVCVQKEYHHKEGLSLRRVEVISLEDENVEISLESETQRRALKHMQAFSKNTLMETTVEYEQR